jgi:hypothetical protein
VTFQATVTAGGNTPVGSVKFYQNQTTLLGEDPLDPNGIADIPVTFSAIGTYTITAVFTPGNTNYISSTSSTLTQQVNPETQTTLSSNSNNNKTKYGEYVTFSASVDVQSPGTGPATGSVQFKDGTKNLDTAKALANGVATLSILDLIPGDHPITAVYIPDANFAPSTSNTVTHKVEAAATTAALVASHTTATTTETVFFTATVTVNSPGSGTATGKVQFKDGPNLLDEAPLTGGVATYNTTFPSTGPHQISAAYISDSACFQNHTSSKWNLTIN